MLQSYDHFTIPALSPAVWNVVIIVLLVVLAPHFHGEDKIYAFAIGILAATVVQLLMAFGALSRIDFRLPSRSTGTTRASAGLRADAAGDDRPRDRQPRPADQLGFGQPVSEQAPSAINYAFRIYMLPQGCSAWPSRPCCSRR